MVKETKSSLVNNMSYEKDTEFHVSSDIRCGVGNSHNLFECL